MYPRFVNNLQFDRIHEVVTCSYVRVYRFYLPHKHVIFAVYKTYVDVFTDFNQTESALQYPFDSLSFFIFVRT